MEDLRWRPHRLETHLESKVRLVSCYIYWLSPDNLASEEVEKLTGEVQMEKEQHEIDPSFVAAFEELQGRPLVLQSSFSPSPHPGLKPAEYSSQLLIEQMPHVLNFLSVIYFQPALL